MTKKGAAEWSLIVTSMFLLAILMIFTFSYFSTEIDTENAVIEGARTSDSTITLLNILRTEVNGKSLANIIVEDYKKNDFADFKKELSNVMLVVYGEGNARRMEVILLPDDKVVFSNRFSDNTINNFDVSINDIAVNLPIDSNKYLEVRLYD